MSEIEKVEGVSNYDWQKIAQAAWNDALQYRQEIGRLRGQISSMWNQVHQAKREVKESRRKVRHAQAAVSYWKGRVDEIEKWLEEE